MYIDTLLPHVFYIHWYIGTTLFSTFPVCLYKTTQQICSSSCNLHWHHTFSTYIYSFPLCWVGLLLVGELISTAPLFEGIMRRGIISHLSKFSTLLLSIYFSAGCLFPLLKCSNLISNQIWCFSNLVIQYQSLDHSQFHHIGPQSTSLNATLHFIKQHIRDYITAAI